MSIINKHKNFLNLVRVIAQRSHDLRTQVGAIIVGPDGEIRSTGFNGFPRNFQDNLPERLVAPEKYKWMVHAELNAILNAVRVGIPLRNCELYTSIFPCNECAKAIIQAGITSITIDAFLDNIFKNYLKETDNNQHSIEIAERILKEGNIIIYEKTGTEKSPNKILIGGQEF